MALKSHIVDGTGRRYTAGVTKDNRLLVSATLTDNVVVDVGQVEVLTTLPFRQYFTTDGTSGGTNDMRVNGSTTPVDFYIPAGVVGDIYITRLSVVISDTSMTMAKFGAITALTNGVTIFFTSSSYGDVIIHDALKSNFDFVRAGTGIPGTGASNDAFIISSVAGNSDGLLVNIDLAALMPSYGVKLSYGSTQKFVVRVRDNITTIDGFNVIAFGFVRLPQ